MQSVGLSYKSAYQDSCFFRDRVFEFLHIESPLVCFADGNISVRWGMQPNASQSPANESGMQLVSRELSVVIRNQNSQLLTDQKQVRRRSLHPQAPQRR